MSNLLLPDVQKTTALCEDIRKRCVTGLRHLVADITPLPDNIAIAAQENLRQLDQSVVEPALFALCANLRDAALHDDKQAFDSLRAQFSAWKFVPLTTHHLPRLRPLGQGDALPLYDQQAKVDLLRTVLADECNLTTQLVAPDSETLDRCLPMIEQACITLSKTAPDWAAETFALVREIVVAVDRNGENRARFAGGSTFDMFGAILINPARLKNLASLLITIIHESAHQRLFMYHLEDPVILNDSAAIYKSPLRQEGRPMEGIYHAAFVSAREAAAGRVVLASPAVQDLLSADEQATIARKIVSSQRVFAETLAVVRDQGKLTELGQKIMDDAVEIAV